ncbi:MAG TPA: TniB family NTP-binding protein [Chloroflexia bacterium]|jgi:hypothetical protein
MSHTTRTTGQSNANTKVVQLKQLQDALGRLITEVPLDLETVSLDEFSTAEIDTQVSSLQDLLGDVGKVFQTLREAGVISADNPISALAARQVELAALFAARHSDGNAPSNLTAAEVRATRDPALALQFIKRMWIDHPAQRLAFAKLELAYHASIPGKPHNLMLLAHSFAGKTDTLILHHDKHSSPDEPYEVMFDPTHGDIRVRRQRVKIIECPNDGVFTKMQRSLLRSLGDPYADEVKPQVLTPRTCEFLDRAGTRTLAFDDINNGIQVGESGEALRSKEAIFNLAKALRAFAADLVLQKVNVSIVLSGVPIATELRKTNKQFANRFNDLVYVNLYGWSRKRPDEALLFMAQVQSFLEDIPLADQTPPTEKDFPIIAKLHWSTEGNIGHLVGIVKDAAHYALALGHRQLSEDHLAYAFDNRNMSGILPKDNGGKARSNPFRTPEFKYPIESEYAQIKSYSDLLS